MRGVAALGDRAPARVDADVGEIGATAGADSLANDFRGHLPQPLDRIDRGPAGRAVTYLGQQLKDPNGLWLTEFWNRSLEHVASLDGAAPGPGPTFGPYLKSIDGTLSQWTGDPYDARRAGVTLQAPIVGTRGGLVLYRTPKAVEAPRRRRGRVLRRLVRAEVRLHVLRPPRPGAR